MTTWADVSLLSGGGGLVFAPCGELGKLTPPGPVCGGIPTPPGPGPGTGSPTPPDSGVSGRAPGLIPPPGGTTRGVRTPARSWDAAAAANGEPVSGGTGGPVGE